MSGPGNRQHDAPPGGRRLLLSALDAPAALTVALAAAAVYIHAVNYYFSKDDFTFLARARGLLPYQSFLSPLGTRIVSTRLYFQAMNALFGLDPGPYHWASLLLHAVNASLVYLVAVIFTRKRAPALVAGAAFATFDLAFTAVFWASGIQDLLATFFLLLTALIWVASERKGPLAAAFSAATFALSLLSKETGVLFPAVLFALARAQGEKRRRVGAALLPHAALSAAALAMALAQSAKVPAGGAYETAFTSHIFHNLFTYIAWTAEPARAFKDRVAAISYDAWHVALPAAALLAAFLITTRGRLARSSRAATTWYVLALVPVLPLLRHTYLYYLYPAAPGAAIFVGLAVERLRSALAARLGPPGRHLDWILPLVATAALSTTGAIGVRAREAAKLPPDYKLPYDNVLRAATIAGTAAESFAAVSIPEGAEVLLINPFPGLSSNLVGELKPGQRRTSYDMVRSALRDGLALKLLKPGLGDVNFAYRMEHKWEREHALMYDGDGKLTYLGTGADIWANMSSAHLLLTKNLEEAAACARRALDINPDQPRAHMNLGIVLAKSGSADEAREHLERAAALATTDRMRARARKWLESLEEAPR